MSRYQFLKDFSEGPGVELDLDKVRFLTDVFSDDFKFMNRDVVERKDVDPQLLERLEERKLVEPYYRPVEGVKTFYRAGSVVTMETLGEELTSRLLLTGVLDELPPVEAGDDFTMTETPKKKRKKKKKE